MESPTGPVRLRAEFTPEVINLHWYDENNNRITVSNSSNTCTYDTAINLPTNPTKTGYKFKGWKVMPDTAIEYIESTGTQWIDTGFKFTGNVVKYDLVYTLTNGEMSYRSLFGASDNDTKWTGIQHYFPTSGVLRNGTYIGRSSQMNTNVDSINTKYTYSLTVDKNNRIWQLTKSGNTYNGTFVGDICTTVNVALFGHSMSNGSATQLASYKNHGFKITQDDVLVRDLVPAKDADGVVCMYDKVSGQYFYNAGTGDFIAGPDI